MKELKATSNDSVILTSLKPMESLNLSIPVLLYDQYCNPVVGIFFDSCHVICDGVVMHYEKFIGWHFIPKFIPEWTNEKI